MNSLIKTMHLKLILNSNRYKNKIPFPISNKDVYLFDLVRRKRKEKIENSLLSSNDINHKSKFKINNLFKDSNAFDKLKDISQILKKNEDSKKIFDADLKFIFKKPSKKIIKFNSTNFIKQYKTEKFDISKKITNPLPLQITPLSRTNAIFIPKINNKRNNLKKIQKSYTTIYYKRNEEILKNNFLSITPIKKNLIFKSTKTSKISEGTQINSNLFNEIKFSNIKKNPAINKYKYCSSKNFIFQKKLKKIKSVDYYYRFL